MESCNTDKKIEFLYAAIDSSQRLIKFTDTKTAAAIAIISAMVADLLNRLGGTFEKIVEYSSLLGCLFNVTFLILVLLLISCIIIAGRIIKPTNNPTENLNIDSEDIESVKNMYYIYKSKYASWNHMFFNSDKHKLDIKFKDYCDKINELDPNKIIKVLSFEILKVSFIRSIKDDRFKWLVRLLIATGTVFFVNYVLYIYLAK
jgi:hypothetical protein